MGPIGRGASHVGISLAGGTPLGSWNGVEVGVDDPTSLQPTPFRTAQPKILFRRLGYEVSNFLYEITLVFSSRGGARGITVRREGRARYGTLRGWLGRRIRSGEYAENV